MKILITGGLGFLGSNLARRLVDMGHDVSIIDWSIDQKNIEDISDQITLFNSNIVIAEFCNRAVKDQDAVFHFASQVSHIVSQDDPYQDLDTNMRGTLNILEAVRELAPEIPVIYSCSRSVYGIQFHLPVTEGAPTRPIDNYGITKLAAEKYLLLYNYHYGLKTVSMRMANLFGPRQVLTPVYQFIAYVFFCVMTGRPFTFYGDGTQTRDFLYVGDACDAYITAMENIDVASGQIFNLGGKTYTTWSTAMEMAREVTGGEINVSYIPHTPLRARLENPHSCLDYAKIAETLGWTPKTTLTEGFKYMRNFYSEGRWKRYLK